MGIFYHLVTEEGHISYPGGKAAYKPYYTARIPYTGFSKTHIVRKKKGDSKSADHLYYTVEQWKERVPDSRKHSADYIYHAQCRIKQAGDLKSAGSQHDNILILYEQTGDSFAEKLDK